MSVALLFTAVMNLNVGTSATVPQHYPQLRFFLGDVRDGGRLRRALEGIDSGPPLH